MSHVSEVNRIEKKAKVSKGKKLFRFIKKNPVGILGFILVAISVTCALFAQWLTPMDPMASVLSDRLLPPSWASDAVDNNHFLGTDQIGRDLFSRIIYGAS